MITLKSSLAHWQTDLFEETFKHEVSRLSVDELPLQQAITVGSIASLDDFSVIINRIAEQHDFIIINTGIFYSSILAGCSCADDPTPLDKNTEYCEIQFRINKYNAETETRIIPN